MKGIFIDAKKRQVTEVEIEKGLQPIYDLLGIETFECVYIDDKETIYVDEEGLYKDDTEWFFFEGTHQPIRGNGLILSTDDDGESVSTNLSLEYVKSKVKFLNTIEVYLMSKQFSY